MSGISVQIPAIISVVNFLLVAIFQPLLTFGAPLGEFSWGGRHKGVLPANLRFASLVGAVLLVCMALVVLGDTDVISVGFQPPRLLLWVITGFMALNTLGNLASKSKYEKIIMTPLTGIAVVACLLVAMHYLTRIAIQAQDSRRTLLAKEASVQDPSSSPMAIPSDTFIRFLSIFKRIRQLPFRSRHLI